MTTLNIDGLTLANGAHSDRDEGVCLMEAVAWFAGEPHTDAPRCVSPYLRQFGISLNDRVSDAKRQDLRRFIPLVVGTANDGRDETRRWIAADHVTRVTLPKWLDAAGLTTHAETLRNLAPIVDRTTYAASRNAVYEARSAAWALRNEKLGGDLYDYVYKRVKKAVSEALAGQSATAAADAAAAATTADVPTFGTEAYWAWRRQIHDAVYAKVRAIYEERFAELVTDSWSDALGLYERLITAQVSE